MEYIQRKKTRLEKYDYSHAGIYFLTLCTQNKRCLFSKITENEDGGKIELTEHGKIIDNCISLIDGKYNIAAIDKYVIMPNHMHLLLKLTDDDNSNKVTVGKIMGWFKYETTKMINNAIDGYGEGIWQRSYHDHIIRNDEDYLKHWQYIEDNPARWADDEYYEK